MDNPNQDFNSSDVEFEPPPREARGRGRGQASIDAIRARADELRVSTKRTVKQLEFSAAAPSTRLHNERWANRLNMFRQEVLHQDLDTPFTGNELVRFFDAMIDVMKPGGNRTSSRDGVATPVEKTIRNAIQSLIEYGKFQWKDFAFTQHDQSRINAFINACLAEHRLERGYAKERTWITFVTLSRMTRGFLAHNHSQRPNWNVVVAKMLSITLIAALGCRAGDVTLSAGYTDQFLRYSDIALYVDGRTATFHNIEATFTLRYVKGKKISKNDYIQRYFGPLRDVDTHVCPIVWLLVHALRNKLVFGDSLQQVLERAIARPDHLVEWVQPSYPVLAAFTHRDIDLPTRAMIHQISATVKEMGEATSMLHRVYPHALRSGAAKDMAHLPSSEFDGQGATTAHIQAIMGHQNPAVTRRYVGDPTFMTWNARAENKHIDRTAPTFSSESAHEFINRPISQDEIQEYGNSSQQPSHINRRIRDARAKTFRDVATVADRGGEDTEGVLLSGLDEEPGLNQECLDDEADRVLLGAAAGAETTAEEFIEKYTRINTPRLSRAEAKRALRERDRNALQGLKRPRVKSLAAIGGHRCQKTPGCKYISAHPMDTMRHELRCTPSKMVTVEKTLEVFYCRVTPGCEFTTLLRYGHKRHEEKCAKKGGGSSVV
ncbi:hypothetical protein PENDEC_c002G00680 [Penicillium decumbens]|uniref:C2H2-type domain-containing protein n=1 Tax=Penicillium decumbens TaxID=69771 RepID=A0A1V6PKH5_PENDC|nr:hypothetical protein PENDEC_c002G00680 [Penicillium decumbens]